jgi:hypothetical protein
MPEGFDLVVVVHRDLSGADPTTFRTIVGGLFRRAGLLQDLPSHDGSTAATPDG